MLPSTISLLESTEKEVPDIVAWAPGGYVELVSIMPPFGACAAVFPAITMGEGEATTTELYFG